MNSKPLSNLPQKLLLYGVGASAVALAAPAHATIHETVVDPALVGNTLSFDPVTGNSSATFNDTFALTTTSDTMTSKATAGAMTGNGEALDASGNVLELPAGTFLDGTSSFSANGNFNTMYSTNGTTATGDWTPGSTGYLGLQLTVNGSADYGWAEVTLYGVPPLISSATATANAFSPAVAPSQGFSLLAFAYEDSGAGITTGVPEPASTTALLVAGAAGVVAWRRRRGQAQD